MAGLLSSVYSIAPKTTPTIGADFPITGCILNDGDALPNILIDPAIPYAGGNVQDGVYIDTGVHDPSELTVLNVQGDLSTESDFSVDGDSTLAGDLTIGGKANYKSGASLINQPFQGQLASLEYVQSQDDSTVKSGALTHVDSDDQGDSALGVWFDGKFVYLANDTGGLHVYSRDNSGNLTHLDFDDQGDNARGVWGDGKFIYLANNTGGLLCYTVSDVGILTLVDSNDPGGRAYNVCGGNGFIYLANDVSGLSVFSVDSAGALTHVDSDNQGDRAFDVWFDGRFVYLANDTGGLLVYSVSASGTLTYIGKDDQGDRAFGVWGDGKYIYLANYTGGLHVYTVDNAGALTHVDSDDQGGNYQGVWGDGRYIYAAVDTNGVYRYTVSEAGVLTYLGADDPGDNAVRIFGDDEFLYLANFTGGLHVYSKDNAYEYDKATGDHLFNGPLSVLEQTTPTAIAGRGAFYTKSDNIAYFQDGAGNEKEIKTADASYGEMYFDDNAVATTISTANVPILIENFTTGLVEGFTFGAGSNGSITAFADAGGGQVTVTSAAHGLANGDDVSIHGTTNYNGVFEVANVTINTFEITDTWVANDATGTWHEGSYLECGVAGLYAIAWSASAAEGGPAGSSVIAGIYNNSVPCVNCKAKRKFPSNDYGSFGSNTIISLAAGDRIYLYFTSTGTNDITIEYGALTIHRL